VTAPSVNGGFGVGFPVIDGDDPTAVDALLRQAAALLTSAPDDNSPGGEHAGAEYAGLASRR